MTLVNGPEDRRGDDDKKQERGEGGQEATGASVPKRSE
jgi:hypothetical protein